MCEVETSKFVSDKPTKVFQGIRAHMVPADPAPSLTCNQNSQNIVFVFKGKSELVALKTEVLR